MGYGKKSTYFGVKQIWIKIDLASHFHALSLRREVVGAFKSTPTGAQRCTCTCRQGRSSGEATSLLGRPWLAGGAILSSGYLLFPTRLGREGDLARRTSTELPAPKCQA